MKANPNGLMWIGGLGAAIAALCCFTPIAVIALGLVGAGAAVAWLDSILFPALFLFGALFIAAWIWRGRQIRGNPKSASPPPQSDTGGQ